MSITLDADAADPDWIKGGTWDIPASNLDELKEWLMAQQITFDHFKTGEVYLSNLDKLPWLRNL